MMCYIMKVFCRNKSVDTDGYEIFQFRRNEKGWEVGYVLDSDYRQCSPSGEDVFFERLGAQGIDYPTDVKKSLQELWEANPPSEICAKIIQEIGDRISDIERSLMKFGLPKTIGDRISDIERSK